MHSIFFQLKGISIKGYKTIELISLERLKYKDKYEMCKIKLGFKGDRVTQPIPWDVTLDPMSIATSWGFKTRASPIIHMI